MRELERGGQVFYVHNRVQTIETVRRRLERLVPEATFAVKTTDEGFNARAIELRLPAGKDAALCVKCGQIKGADTCCAADAATCDKCELAKGSPGCCKIDKATP